MLQRKNGCGVNCSEVLVLVCSALQEVHNLLIGCHVVLLQLSVLYYILLLFWTTVHALV